MGANNSSLSRVASRSSGDHVIGTNNLPPITFHSTHGDNVRIMNNGSVAKRTESFCKGIAFSNRPVRVNEKVFLKFSETSTSWSGVLRFGFTSVDPGTNRGGLPKYACPDFTNKPGYWAKAMAERYADRDTVLFYYVTPNGDVHFGINGVEKGVFFSGVDTRGPLWAILDIYGNTVAMEILDPRSQVNNTWQRSMSLPSGVNSSHVEPGSHNRNPAHGDALQMPSSVLSLRHNVAIPIQDLKFHSTHGCNVRLSNDGKIATRDDTEFNRGYVFLERPLLPGERVVIQVLETACFYVSSLAFGLTTCDPTTLQSSDLPEDPSVLLDRPEYWVIHEDVANVPQTGDELGFSITQDGEVLLFKNRNLPNVIMHVDQTQRMWAFFDVYGNTKKIKIMGITTFEGVHPTSGDSAHASNDPQLRVILPPAGSSGSLDRDRKGCSPRRSFTEDSLSLAHLSNSDEAEVDGSADNASNECAVCYEKPVDSVLYTCGHMCMCYECAYQLWTRPGGGGSCPICRAEIRDVIRTYRS